MRLIQRSDCPICKHKEFQIIYRTPYASTELKNYLISFYGPQGYPDITELENEIFELAECANCDMIFQLRIPDEESLTELYTRWISSDKVYDLYEKKRDLSYVINNFLMLYNLVDHLGTRDFRLLDYGFGSGYLLMQARLLGIDTYGFEINPEQKLWAQSNGIICLDKFDSTTPKMDVIFCEQVLEHVVEPRAVMENLACVSHADTILHISVPDAYNIKNILANIDWNNMKGNENSVNVFAPLEHINSFRVQQLVLLASEFGFEPYHLENRFQLTLKPVFLKPDLKYIVKLNKTLIKNLIKQIVGYKSSSKTSPFLSTYMYFKRKN